MARKIDLPALWKKSVKDVHKAMDLYDSAGVRHFSLLRSGLRKTETAPCGDSIAGHFSKNVRSGAPPVCWSQRSKANPTLHFDVAHPPKSQRAANGTAWLSRRAVAAKRFQPSFRRH